ncbi:hypothetical protein ATCC90586_005134 [Pythium insidiosum]|nr:hypothetical protein ATCC90586_005134 [Pythium insidiosum]
MFLLGSSLASSRLAAAARLSDRHSCLAAPYAPTDPRTARYFEVVISKADAPVVCGFAGKLKGKAIYADRDLRRNTRIWTEAPFLGMQHELNKRLVPCCQYCFVPLIADYQAQWSAMAARWNDALRLAPDDPRAAHAHDLDEALERLHVQRRHCGLVGAAARCVCGDLYCSKLCQIRAYHEFHAVLCPRADPFSAMSEFVRHTQETNDIFLLAAKVIARVLCRFLVSRDLIKAREPMDMFYKKPWWEVVMMERQVQQHQYNQQPPPQPGSDRSDAAASRTAGSARGSGDGSSPDADDAAAPANSRDDRSSSGFDDGASTDASHSPASSSSGESQCLKDLLMSTHQLLADALECNLVHLEREDQLHGLTVDEVWTACASVLSFEFFAAQLGLFEMNNIRVEVDHPFQALMEVLENDGRDLDPPSRHPLGDDDDDEHGDDDNDGGAANGTTQHQGATPDGGARASPSGSTDEVSTEDRELFARVRAVLAFTAEDCITQQLAAMDRDNLLPSMADAALAAAQLRGFPSVDGTALFPIVCTMNHSCDPNCTVLYTKNGDAHVVAVRDIQRGEELCICYVDVDQDVQQREASLREYQFRCFCRRCTSERRVGHHAAADDDRDSVATGDASVEYESRRHRSEHPYHLQQHQQHIHHSHSQRPSHGEPARAHDRHSGHDRSRSHHHSHHHHHHHSHQQQHQYHSDSTHNRSHSS